TVVIAQLLRMHMSPFAAAIGGIAAAAFCGLVNGILVTQLRVVPFIVTLGTMLVIRGAAKGFGEERRIEAPATWLNDLLRVTRGETLLPSESGPSLRSRYWSPRYCGTHGSAVMCLPLDRTSEWRGCVVWRSLGRRS